MKSVDMICISTKDGLISPLKFKVMNKSGEEMVIKIDKVLDRNTEKIAGNKMLVYKVQSNINNISKVYEMKYEINTCKWYIFKI